MLGCIDLLEICLAEKKKGDELARNVAREKESIERKKSELRELDIIENVTPSM